MKLDKMVRIGLVVTASMALSCGLFSELGPEWLLELVRFLFPSCIATIGFAFFLRTGKMSVGLCFGLLATLSELVMAKWIGISPFLAAPCKCLALFMTFGAVWVSVKGQLSFPKSN